MLSPLGAGAGRDDGSQGARRPRGASRCASQPLRAPRPCKHGSLRPRGTPAHRRAPHSLCATRAKFCAGQPRCLDELIFCLVLRDAAALLIVSISRRCVLRPAHCTSPARMSPCAAPQRAMQAKRARACCVRVHMRECARATASRASPARDHLYPRVHVVLQVSTLPASSQPPNQNARFGQDRDQELRAGPRKSEPSPSPARRARASRAHASPGAVSSMPCTDTKVRVYCTVCSLTQSHACATSCIIQRDTTDCVIS